MTDFYISQFLIIQGVTSHDENPVQGILSEIWEIVKSAGQIKPRDVAQKFGGRKINGEKVNTSIARTLLTQLEQAGYGRLEVKSRGMVLHYQEPKELEAFEIEDESLEYQSEIKEEIVQAPTPIPKPELEIAEVESEPVDELSADGVYIDSLPDLEKETVLIRTAASVEIGERTIPPRAVGKVIEATFDTFDNQWLLRVETVLNGSVITFSIPFSDCYLQDIST
jgi:hypothetical protein